MQIDHGLLYDIIPYHKIQQKIHSLCFRCNIKETDMLEICELLEVIK